MRAGASRPLEAPLSRGPWTVTWGGRGGGGGGGGGLVFGVPSLSSSSSDNNNERLQQRGPALAAGFRGHPSRGIGLFFCSICATPFSSFVRLSQAWVGN